MVKKQALVVEDNKEIGQIYALTLEMAHYQSEHIIDGKSAMDRLDEITPDLIVLDMNLPLVSGHYIYKKIRADPRLNQTVVVISTANTLVANALSKEMAPQDHLLMKPVSARQLRQIAETLNT